MKSNNTELQLNTLMKHFQMYCKLHNDLDQQYIRLPWWRFIGREILLHRMGKLTKNYGRWLDQWQKNYNFQKEDIQE